MRALVPGLVALLVAGGATAGATKPAPKSPAAETLSELRALFDLKVPDLPSTRFRSVSIGSDRDGAQIACGMFNAKTSGGGYAGWRYFVFNHVKGQDPVILTPPDGTWCSKGDAGWFPGDFSHAMGGLPN
jgi:hypothetical protein